jgi:hypothetical protein
MVNIAICNANEIHTLNKTKEYTLTCTYLLEKVITDTNICGQSAKLWQILFNRARFHTNLEVNISYQELSKVLKRSARSICRYISSLINHGYLATKHNYDIDGSQKENTIYIRCPQYFINEAQQLKDRDKSSASAQFREDNTKKTNQHIDIASDKNVRGVYDKNDVQNNIIKKNNMKNYLFFISINSSF